MGFDQLRGQHICDGNRADAAPGLGPAIYLVVRTGLAVHGDPGRRHRARRQGQEWETTQKQHQEMLQLWQGGVQGEHPKNHVPKTRSEAEHSKDLAPSRARPGSCSTTSAPLEVGLTFSQKKSRTPVSQGELLLYSGLTPQGMDALG